MVPNSHVGFDSITSQIEKKLLKRGFQFNVICVGMAPCFAAPLPPPPILLSFGSRDSSLTSPTMQARPGWASPL